MMLRRLGECMVCTCLASAATPFGLDPAKVLTREEPLSAAMDAYRRLTSANRNG